MKRDDYSPAGLPTPLEYHDRFSDPVDLIEIVAGWTFEQFSPYGPYFLCKDSKVIRATSKFNSNAWAAVTSETDGEVLKHLALAFAVEVLKAKELGIEQGIEACASEHDDMAKFYKSRAKDAMARRCGLMPGHSDKYEADAARHRDHAEHMRTLGPITKGLEISVEQKHPLTRLSRDAQVVALTFFITGAGNEAMFSKKTISARTLRALTELLNAGMIRKDLVGSLAWNYVALESIGRPISLLEAPKEAECWNITGE